MTEHWVICMGGAADGAEFQFDDLPPRTICVPVAPTATAKEQLVSLDDAAAPFDIYIYRGHKGEDPAIFLYEHGGRTT